MDFVPFVAPTENEFLLILLVSESHRLKSFSLVIEMYFTCKLLTSGSHNHFTLLLSGRYKRKFRRSFIWSAPCILVGLTPPTPCQRLHGGTLAIIPSTSSCSPHLHHSAPAFTLTIYHSLSLSSIKLCCSGHRVYCLSVDQNECSYDNGGCVHLCHNAHGGYACSCYAGFTLRRNGQDCVGQYSLHVLRY